MIFSCSLNVKEWLMYSTGGEINENFVLICIAEVPNHSQCECHVSSSGWKTTEGTWVLRRCISLCRIPFLSGAKIHWSLVRTPENDLCSVSTKPMLTRLNKVINVFFYVLNFPPRLRGQTAQMVSGVASPLHPFCILLLTLFLPLNVDSPFND